MEEIAKLLISEFSIYNSNTEYYYDLVKKYNGDGNNYAKLRSLICREIQKNFCKNKYKWFINFLKKAKSLQEIVEVLERFSLNLTIDNIADFIEQVPNFEKLILQRITPNRKYTFSQLDTITSNITEQNILLAYMSLNDLIDVEVNDKNNESLSVKDADYFINDIYKSLLLQANLLSNYDENARLIKEYMGIKEILKKELSQEERKKLERKLENKRDEIVTANLLLVVSIANRYKNVFSPFEDLYQFGCMGLMRALEKYDINKKTQFSTYAVWWIRQYIIRYKENYENIIRIPANKSQMNRAIKKAIDILGVAGTTNDDIFKIAEYTGFSIKAIKEYFRISQAVFSLDEPISGKDFENDLYILVDDPTAEEDLLRRENKDAVKHYMNIISKKPREEFVIRMHFGLPKDNDPRFERKHTLEEVGKELNITHERARQIENSALRRVRRLEHIPEPPKQNSRKGFSDWFENPKKAQEILATFPQEVQDIMHLKYGPNLDEVNKIEKKYVSVVFNILTRIQKKLDNPYYKPKFGRMNIFNKPKETALMLISPMFAETPLKNPIFKEIVLTMPKEYQIPMAYRLGLVDGLIHSIDDIAYRCNLREDDVREILDKGYTLFIDGINEYKESIKIDTERQMLLNLLK